MKTDLQLFASQLAAWINHKIELGRTPFRKVDVYETIHSASGSGEVPLILWINRQSMMAGGLILLPDGDLAAELDKGKNYAAALGLRHFVSWEKDIVRIWQIDTDNISEYRRFKLDDQTDHNAFRNTLDDLLDSLKLTAVLGAVGKQELSCDYFNNLFKITLQQTQATITTAWRSQQPSRLKRPEKTADDAAVQANRLVLLQILALLWHDQMPQQLLPEKLERALELSRNALPESLHQPLTAEQTEAPALPLEAAVDFHHLILRLRQLAWSDNKQRCYQNLLDLANSWFPLFDETPPAQPNQFYPQAPCLLPDNATLLSDSPSLLALSALLQSRQQTGTVQFLSGSLLQLQRDSFSAADVQACLLHTQQVCAEERKQISGCLRSSWPHRRFRIQAGQPLAGWELIHLAGIAQPGQRMLCTCPLELLSESPDGFIWTLLGQQLQLKSVCKTGASCSLEMVKQAPELQPLKIVNGQLTIELERHEQNLSALRGQTLLALHFEPALYQQLEESFCWSQNETLTGQQQAGLEIYQQTRLYQQVKQQLHGLQSYQIQQQHALPPQPCLLPSLKLELLQQLAAEQRSLQQLNQDASADSCLAQLLDCPALVELELPQQILQPAATTTSPIKQVKEDLLQLAEEVGLPNFPEQYLYFLDQPTMHNYDFSPPLLIKERMLGYFIAEDQSGQQIEGFGDELEKALIICSVNGKSRASLPQDREQLGSIIDRYQRDLNDLHDKMQQSCYSQLEDPAVAKRLLGRIWKQLQLPEPKWFQQNAR